MPQQRSNPVSTRANLGFEKSSRLLDSLSTLVDRHAPAPAKQVVPDTGYEQRRLDALRRRNAALTRAERAAEQQAEAAEYRVLTRPNPRGPRRGETRLPNGTLKINRENTGRWGRMAPSRCYRDAEAACQRYQDLLEAGYCATIEYREHSRAAWKRGEKDDWGRFVVKGFMTY